MPRTMTNAAIDYLKASGAIAISVVEIDGVCTFQIGVKISPHAIEAQWLPETAASAIVKRARCDAGKAASVSAAIEALHGAAADQRVTLTPHAMAVDRARTAVARLDSYLEAGRTGGVLQKFNAEFKRRRTDAKADGKGFMSYSVATSRLRRALVPLLMSGGHPAIGQTLFGEVFG
jgi:hypothetical protein